VAVSAALVLMMMLAMVWMLRLLVAAEDARRAQARTVVLEERLRVAREIHDAVGHKMAVIALKAEVAGRFAASDVARTRAETEEIRKLTTSTLIEVRRALHGDTVADIDTQLETARTVLASAGIAADLAAPSFPMSDQESQLLAAVVREAVTNILRHADASRVTVSFPRSEGGRAMVIANDVQRVPERIEPARSGTGLDGLAARCAAMTARLEVARPSPTSFRLTVRLPPIARSDG
jgi:two-component system sensor histidine kinase DesK